MTTDRNRRRGLFGTPVALPDLTQRAGSGPSIAEEGTRAHERAREAGPEPQDAQIDDAPDRQPVEAPRNGIERPPRRRWKPAGPRFSIPARLAGAFLVADVVDICHRQPPSLSQSWQLHRHHAEMWRTEHAPPPPVPTVDEWGMPVEVVKRQKAEPAVPVRGPLGWPGKARYVWACPHLLLVAMLYLLDWAAEKPSRALLITGLVWIVFFVWRPL
jgi:hypothetical protein